MGHYTDDWRLTPAQRQDYAQKCKEMAERMRLEGDLYSAEINDWMAESYSKPE